MSKTINPDKLSKFDRQYLADRGIDPDEYSEKFTLNEDGELVAREDADEPSDAERNQADEDDPALQASGDPEKDDPEVESDDEDVPYSEWTNDELRAELKSRGLTTSGKQPDLISRLEAHDATNVKGDAERDTEDDA